jgi:hypothetical protein
MRAVMPAKPAFRLMKPRSDLVLEVKRTVRPRGDTEAYTRAETTEMTKTALEMHNDKVHGQPAKRVVRLIVSKGLSGGVHSLGMGRTHEAGNSGQDQMESWYRRS